MTPMERFLLKINIHAGDACWNWAGSQNGNGYGQFWFSGRLIPAHHFLLDIPVPKGKEACHRCDNRLCVRPSHIFVGTRSDNMQDCFKKGRLRPLNGYRAMVKIRNQRGSRNPASKLTEEQAREIKQAPNLRGIGAKLSRDYGVSQTVISGIRNGTRWLCLSPDVAASA